MTTAKAMSNPTITKMHQDTPPDNRHDTDLERGGQINRVINSTSTTPPKGFRYSDDDLQSVLNDLSEFVEVNHTSDKDDTALQKLQSGLSGYKKLLSTTEYKHFKFYIINCSSSADNHRIHVARDIHSARRHIFPMEDFHCNCPEQLATQDTSDIKAQILLHASSGVHKKVTPTQLKVMTSFASEKYISDMFSRFTTKLLLAFLMVKWEVKPSEFLQVEPMEGQILPPFRSGITLPSTLRSKTVGPTSSQKIMWFRTAPTLVGYFKALGSRDYYNQRPCFSSVAIYLPPSVQPVPKAFLVFNNMEALGDFSAKLKKTLTDHEATQSLPILLILLKDLLLQIVQDSVNFLERIALGIDDAKHSGLKSPSKTKVEYLIHVEGYLREMPLILDTTIQSFRTLSTVHLDISTGWINEVTEDIDYLKQTSEELRTETTSIKQMIANHIAIAQTAQMRNLTILASIFVPLSFVATFFGMNFNPKDRPTLNIKVFWGIGIPLTFTIIILPLVIRPLIRYFTVVDAPGLGRLFTELFMFILCVASAVLALFIPWVFLIPLIITSAYCVGLSHVAIGKIRNKSLVSRKGNRLSIKRNKEEWITIYVALALCLISAANPFILNQLWYYGVMVQILIVLILFGYRWFLRNRSQEVVE